MKNIYLLPFFIIISLSCQRRLYKTYDVSSANNLFSQSVKQTSVPVQENIVNSLLSIHLDSNKLIWSSFKDTDHILKPYLLAVMWKGASDSIYYRSDSLTGFCPT